jgi:DnaJ-class molecular chaperone
MQADMDKLIEKLMDEVKSWTSDKNYEIARDCLSVIIQNVHLVAKVCPGCLGSGKYVVPQVLLSRGVMVECKTCKGHGVVPVKE